MFNKSNGQVFTPVGIVKMILDALDYKGEKILSRKIMEPSFGNGQFILEIFNRIIEESIRLNKSKEAIISCIKTCVYGIEKDPKIYDEAIKKFESLFAIHDLPLINWEENFICGNTLDEYVNFNDFDYVVGNPPYVRVHNMDDETKEKIENFEFKEGNSDLYIIFYEIGIKMLKKNDGGGVLGYISPNSFLRNSSQKKFRNKLIEEKLIHKIYDFKNSKIFDTVDTYTCICVLHTNTSRINNHIIYREYEMYDILFENIINYSYFEKNLHDKSWNLSSDEDIKFIENNKKLPIKIGNIAIVQHGIATNKDSIYIKKVYEDSNLTNMYMDEQGKPKKMVYFHDDKLGVVKIESTILRRCVKASRYDGKMDNTYIIFPYENQKIPYSKCNLIKGVRALTEEELKKFFPNAYDYLLRYWGELSVRDLEKNTEWFLFGRSQGLKNINLKKVVFKHIISKSNDYRIQPYILPEDVIVYSGIYTIVDLNIVMEKGIFIEKSYQNMLNILVSIFSNSNFVKYCQLLGKDMSGNYVGINTNIIKEYGTNLSSFLSFPVSFSLEIENLNNNYYNELFHRKFIDCIKESYQNMGSSGKTSPERIKPFHSFIAKILQYKLGTDYEIFASGYSYGREAKLQSAFGEKNVDICVKKDGKVLGAIAFKLMSNNFKQNLNNFSESLLGESIQMRELKLPYAFCYLIPEKAMYLTKNNTFKKIDKLTQKDLEKYFKMINDPSYKQRTPDSLFIGVHKLFDDNYLNNLKDGDSIHISDSSYLNSVVPEWSNYNFVDDDDMKEYFIYHNNIGKFLDKFIEEIKNSN